VEILRLPPLKWLLSGEYPETELLSTVNSTIVPPSLSLPWRAQLNSLTRQATSSLHSTELHHSQSNICPSLHSTELSSASLRSSLYSLGSDPTGNTVLLLLRACSLPRERVYEPLLRNGLFCCWVVYVTSVTCQRPLFTESPLSNGSVRHNMKEFQDCSNLPMKMGSRDSSVYIVTGYELHGRCSFPGREKFFSLSMPALGPTQAPIQWVPAALSPGVKRRGREAGHSPPSSVEVKNGGAVHPLAHMC
jgi:hypothetical protein